MNIEINDIDDDENIILIVEMKDCPEFKILIPRNMDEILEEDDEPYEYYMNFATRNHYY